MSSTGNISIGGGPLSPDYPTLWVKNGYSSTKVRIDLGNEQNMISLKQRTLSGDTLEIYSVNGAYFSGKYGPYMKYVPHNIYPEGSSLDVLSPVLRVHSANTSMQTLYVNESLYYNYMYSMSDAKVKKNITAYPNGAISQLSGLRAVTYQMDLSEHPVFGQKPEGEIGFSTDTTTRIGFIAQELRKIFPQLVKEDKDGYLAVDYVGLIPVIVEALREQQMINNAQLKKIAEIQSELNALRDRDNVPQSKGLVVQNAFLYQNAPNPFSQTTVIRYFVGEEVSASLYLLDMQGKLLESYPVVGVGEGSVEISTSGLQPGIYFYSLIVNGQDVDTKRMMIAK